MCQGVILSRLSKGRKSLILTGIGSHLSLISDNQKRIEKKFGSVNDSEIQIISCESDFSKGWNHFTIESEMPTKSEMKQIKSVWKETAGSARALISHVKRCGKIDDALVELFTAPAIAEYNKVKAQAWAEYNKVEAQAIAEYNKVTAPAWAEYNKVEAPAIAEYNKVKAPAWAEYNKVKAQAWAEYNKVTAQAWIKLFRDPKNRVAHLR